MLNSKLSELCIEDLGAEYIATGHYARVAEKKWRIFLVKRLDPNKEQSYFLYTLGQKALSKTLFQSATCTSRKSGQWQIKRFPNSRKKDSTGSVLSVSVNLPSFLQRYCLPAWRNAHAGRPVH